MYVDKTLTGLAAVQTLSRLNRTHPDKDGTFVLDFVNDAEAIAAEFEQYHGKPVAPPSDPNLLYDTRHALDEFGVLDAEEARTLLSCCWPRTSTTVGCTGRWDRGSTASATSRRTSRSGSAMR